MFIFLCSEFANLLSDDWNIVTFFVFVNTCIKSEGLRWVGHVEVMVKMKHGYTLLLDESDGRRPFGTPTGR